MRICPECQTRYDDDVSSCPQDGEALVELPAELSGNPAVPEPQQANPADRTSMIDLEAIEAKRAARRAEQEAENPPEDEKTPPPEGPAEDDVEATGTLQRSRFKKKKGSTRLTASGADDVSDIPPDRRVSDDATNRDMSRRDMTKSRRSQQKTREGTSLTRGSRTAVAEDGTRGTGITRRTRLEQAPKKTISGTTATVLALIIVGALIGAIIAVARLSAVLTITTVPPGAAVKLDGIAVGESPVQKRVRTGSHVIELELNDYEPFKEVVDVPSGGLPFLQPLQKKPPPPPPPPTALQIAEELLRHALQLFEANDLEGAKNKLEEANRLAPNHPGILALMQKVDAEIAARADAFSKAQRDAATQDRLRNARVLTEEARRLYDKSQLSPAKDKLYQALKLDPGYPEPHRLLGKIYNREDDVEKVRYHLERYLQLGGSDGDFKVREWLKTHPKR